MFIDNDRIALGLTASSIGKPDLRVVEHAPGFLAQETIQESISCQSIMIVIFFTRFLMTVEDIVVSPQGQRALLDANVGHDNDQVRVLATLRGVTNGSTYR